MSTIPILQEFKRNIITFLDELIDQFPNEADFIIARLLLKDKIPHEVVINTFIQEVMPFKSHIIDRDEKIFLNGNISLFSGLDKSKVNHFKTLWKSTRLDAEDREIIWKWFDIFVLLAEKYQKALQTQN